MKAVVDAFNQEKALVGAFSVITNLRMELFQALLPPPTFPRPVHSSCEERGRDTSSPGPGGGFYSNMNVNLMMSNQTNKSFTRISLN